MYVHVIKHLLSIVSFPFPFDIILYKAKLSAKNRILVYSILFNNYKTFVTPNHYGILILIRKRFIINTRMQFKNIELSMKMTCTKEPK
jgi:hypothetical protein